jgi:hypothetical protein
MGVVLVLHCVDVHIIKEPCPINFEGVAAPGLCISLKNTVFAGPPTPFKRF